MGGQSTKLSDYEQSYELILNAKWIYYVRVFSLATMAAVSNQASMMGLFYEPSPKGSSGTIVIENLIKYLSDYFVIKPCPFSWDGISGPDPLSYDTSEYDYNLFAGCGLPSLTQVSRIAKLRRKSILYMTETIMISQYIGRVLNHFDRVLTPSAWGSYQLSTWGVEASKIKSVSLGFDPLKYYPTNQLRETSDQFTYLAVGKYEERKAIDNVILAFSEILRRKKFPRGIPPRLVLKCGHTHDARMKNHLSTFIQKVPELEGHVQTIDMSLDDNQMCRLYNMAHCFVLPTKGEGFGLPVLEALASGIPVVTTYFSGQSSYLSKIKGRFYKLPFSLAVCQSHEYLRWQDDRDSTRLWAQVTPEDTALGMVEVAYNYDDWQKHGSDAAEILRNSHTWSHAAHSFALSV